MNQRIQLSDHFTTSRILRFAASPIIMMVFTSIYSVVDGFFVSNFAGKQAFAAVNLIMPFLQAFGCIGFMLGTGGSALVAMTLGTGNKKRANELFSMLVCATAVLGVIFTVVALLVLRPAAVLLGATAELLDDCILYGTIITVFQTAFMLQFLFQSFFITAEKPKLGLFFTVAAGLTNMVLDFVFVGVMGLGITGAAAATVISQLIGGIGPMFYFARPGNGSLLHFVRPVFSGKALLKACTNGSSELMTNLSASLVGALYNWQLLCRLHAQAETRGIDPARITVAGDSAGGNLAALCAHRDRDRSLGMVNSQVLYYPALSVWETDGLKDYHFGLEDYIYDDAQSEWIVPRILAIWNAGKRSEDNYLPEGVNSRMASVSPLWDSDFSGLPCTLLITAQYDYLTSQAKTYAHYLAAAHVPVTWVNYCGVGHAFVDKCGVYPQADDSLKMAAEFVR